MSRDVSMTREQQRARGAAQQVEQAKEVLGARLKAPDQDTAVSAGAEKLTPQLKRYNAYAHALPVWIRTNGLLQTVAFLESKARTGKAAELLVGNLAAHLRSASFQFKEPKQPLSQALCSLEYDDYARWQEEAVKCAGWIKRFAAALIGEPDADTDAAGVEG